MPDAEGAEAYQAHGIGLHADCFRAMSREVLASIGWYRGTNGCGALILGGTNYANHKMSCMRCSDDRSAATGVSSTTRDAWFNACPPNRHEDLNTLLEGDAQDATAIKTAIRQWMEESLAAADLDGHTL